MEEFTRHKTLTMAAEASRLGSAHQPHQAIPLLVFHESNHLLLSTQRSLAPSTSHLIPHSPQWESQNTFLCFLKSRKIAFKLVYISSYQAKSFLPFCSRAVQRQESTKREQTSLQTQQGKGEETCGTAHCRDVSFLLCSLFL